MDYLVRNGTVSWTRKELLGFVPTWFASMSCKLSFQSYPSHNPRCMRVTALPKHMSWSTEGSLTPHP